MNNNSFQLFEYKRLVGILLKLIRQRGSAEADSIHRPMSDFVCRISIYLLNSLACQVEGIHKKIVGDLGAVEVGNWGAPRHIEKVLSIGYLEQLIGIQSPNYLSYYLRLYWIIVLLLLL